LRIPSKRKAISPVLATVILIAITLIAAVAIATFVFGIFGSSASPATYSIVTSSIKCSGVGGALPTVGGVAYTGSLAANGVCGMVLQNSGAAAGSVTNAGPSNDFTTVKSDGTGAPFVTQVPAGSTAVVWVTLGYGAGKATSGQTLTGFLVPGGSAANIPFIVVAP